MVSHRLSTHRSGAHRKFFYDLFFIKFEILALRRIYDSYKKHLRVIETCKFSFSFADPLAKFFCFCFIISSRDVT